MTDENTKQLDEIDISKLLQKESIPAQETQRLLNYIEVPEALRDELNIEELHYIDLVDNYNLVDELPENPHDEGAKEHLTESIRIANLLNENNSLVSKDSEQLARNIQHLINDIAYPLQFIYKGKGDQTFTTVLEMLGSKTKHDKTKGTPLEAIIRDIVDESFNEQLLQNIALVATETFTKKMRIFLEGITNEKEGILSNDIVEIREFLPELEQFRYGNTKVENELKNPKRSISDTLTNGGFIANITSRKDKLKGYNYEVPAHFSISDGVTFPPDFSYTLSAALLVNAIGNAYDLAELETQSAGAKTIRADHLINIMNGDTLTTDVRPEAVENLIEEIEPLTTVRVEIDATDHQTYNDRSNKKVQIAQNKFKGYLLPIEVIERKEQSKSKQVYLRILTRPTLYNYANQTGQIIKVKYHTLDLTKEYLEDGTEKPTVVKRMSQQTRSIRDFIINQIYGRGRNLKYTDVKYSTIYDFIEKDLGSKPRKQTLDKNIERVMLALKQKGAIKKYDVIPQGRKKLYKLRIYGGNE